MVTTFSTLSTFYNFKNYLKLEKTCLFKHIWIEENSSWLSYLAIGDMNVAFCRICALLKPNVQ